MRRKVDIVVAEFKKVVSRSFNSCGLRSILMSKLHNLRSYYYEKQIFLIIVFNSKTKKIMYLLQVGTNGISLLSLIVVAVTAFAINYWLIKTAIRDALRYPLESLIAYKLIELKKAGVSYKGLEEAAKYILVHQISRRSAVTKKLKDQTEEWWNSVEEARQEG